MKITKRTFGTLADGTAVSCWTMENAHGLRAELLDYGAAIRSIQVPDRTGRLVDVVLGYDDLAGYTGNPSFYGATIGRFGNRIGGAEFELNGKAYRLAKNNGDNHLHGGLRGFDKYVWQGEAEADGVRFTRVSPDGEEGYPGTLTVSVKFSWQGDGLMLHYTAQCDQDTILNLTNHSYFNLDGEGTVQEPASENSCRPLYAERRGLSADGRACACCGYGDGLPQLQGYRQGRGQRRAVREALPRLRREFLPGRKRSGDRSEVIKKRHRHARDERPARRAALYGQPYERAYWQKRTAIRPPLRVLP